MGRNSLTQHDLKLIVHYASDTGIFTFTQRVCNRLQVGAVAGSEKTDGYRMISIKGKKYFAHRLAWLYEYGRFPKGQIDHIDGNKSNNKISNLRDVCQSINQQNRRKARSNSLCGLLGVTSTPNGTYKARIRLDGVQYYLGSTKTPEEAHKLYLEAKRKLHIGFIE